ncbi:type II toxin-antitoxin system VapC family toxin [Trichlorobacter ammonificans]|uniref:Ribonuclease VapC n=1 Tax=Trichlorobacter ammonificans TaxID=2916410 RepID=A0ABM9DAA6_9BACT|nr:type II toxin-antitoxin system VapC family toxin [Trichlorobacter ammonificans]CAH2031300.1 Ribonuclease VapC [Trichlorobacter ammonificans]
MNIVDSSGWLEYFADGPNAEQFVAPLSDRERLLVPTIIMHEVFKVVLRERGENSALQAVALMRQGTVAPLGEDIALSAARLGVAHKLPMADSIILATARLHNATVWTQDVDFEGLDHVRYFKKQAV